MKKVLAIVLAVMMMATVAFATYTPDPKRHVANVTPGSSMKIDKDGVKDTGVWSGAKNADGTPKYPDLPANYKPMQIIVKDENGDKIAPDGTTPRSVSEAIFRSITNTNYTIQRVRVEKGSKNLVKGVEINDKEERVEVKMVDDLNNQTSKSFEVSFTLKGKAKFILRDNDEVNLYNKYCATSKQASTKPSAKDPAIYESVGKRVTLPDIDFQFIGTVGYGKVEISLGDDNDEEIEDLGSMGVDKENDVVKFKNGGVCGDSKRVAGAFTADAILTEDYGDAMTMEARVYAGDVLYFDCDNDPDRDIVGRLADSDADMDFYLFNSDKNFTTFNSNVKLYFNDADEEDFIYAIKIRQAGQDR